MIKTSVSGQYIRLIVSINWNLLNIYSYFISKYIMYCNRITMTKYINENLLGFLNLLKLVPLQIGRTK